MEPTFLEWPVFSSRFFFCCKYLKIWDESIIKNWSCSCNLPFWREWRFRLAFWGPQKSTSSKQPWWMVITLNHCSSDLVTITCESFNHLMRCEKNWVQNQPIFTPFSHILHISCINNPNKNSHAACVTITHVNHLHM